MSQHTSPARHDSCDPRKQGARTVQHRRRQRPRRRGGERGKRGCRTEQRVSSHERARVSGGVALVVGRSQFRRTKQQGDVARLIKCHIAARSGAGAAATAECNSSAPRQRQQFGDGMLSLIIAVKWASGVPNAVARAHADPLRDWAVLLELLRKRLLGLERLVGRPAIAGQRHAEIRTRRAGGLHAPNAPCRATAAAAALRTW